MWEGRREGAYPALVEVSLELPTEAVGIDHVPFADVVDSLDLGSSSVQPKVSFPPPPSQVPKSPRHENSNTPHLGFEVNLGPVDVRRLPVVVPLVLLVHRERSQRGRRVRGPRLHLGRGKCADLAASTASCAGGGRGGLVDARRGVVLVLLWLEGESASGGDLCDWVRSRGGGFDGGEGKWGVFVDVDADVLDEGVCVLEAAVVLASEGGHPVGRAGVREVGHDRGE